MLAHDCRALIAQYRRDLEAELQKQDVRQEIERLRQIYPVFAMCPSVEAITALVGPGNRNDADEDALLGALLVELKRQPTLFPLLSLLFWRRLLSIFWRKVRSCPDPDYLLLRVCDGFYEVAVTYPRHRPGSIGGNLYWDTWKKVAKWQKEEATYSERHKDFGETPYCNRHEDPKQKAILHKRRKQPAPPVTFYTELADVQESEVFPEELEPYLEEMVLRQVINETQYDLLLETAVYRRMTEKEWAKARGVKYATVRSWRHRAEKAIRTQGKAPRE